MPNLVSLILAVSVIVTPAVAATFSVNIGSPVGGISCGNVIDSGPSPVSGSLVCAPVGGGSLHGASAAATFGHVGGSASAAVGSGYSGTSFGPITRSTFSDFVTFTAVDPGVTHVLVAANLAFSGAMNATASAGAGVDFSFFMGGLGTLFFAASDDGIVRNDFSVVAGGVSGALNNALLRTVMFAVPVNTPVDMTLQLGTSAFVSGGSLSPESATSHFSNSFEIPFGMDAFVLPDGVTANAGDWLVNNLRVAEATGIPEPASWALCR